MEMGGASWVDIKMRRAGAGMYCKIVQFFNNKLSKSY